MNFDGWWLTCCAAWTPLKRIINGVCVWDQDNNYQQDKIEHFEFDFNLKKQLKLKICLKKKFNFKFN